jgi:hypothetical protein
MTPSFDLAGVCADLVILAALAASLGRRTVAPVARPAIATLAFAFAWLTAAALDTMRAPSWTIFLGGAVIVVTIVAMAASLHLWARETDDGDQQRGEDDGGGPWRRAPDGPNPRGGGSEPEWWPEFERQLAAYVSEHGPAVPPAEPPKCPTRS